MSSAGRSVDSMAESVENLEAAMARCGLSGTSKLVKIRQGKHLCLAVEEANSVAAVEPEDPVWVRRESLKNCILKSETSVLTATRREEDSDAAVFVSLRSPYNDENRFVYVRDEKVCDLELRIGFIADPRVEGVGLFSRTKKLCASKLDFVYTFINLKYNKCIAVRPHPTPCVILMDPPTSPLQCENDPRVFFEEQDKSRPDNFRLQPVVCPGLYLTYDEDHVDGEDSAITLSKAGSFLTERNGTPVCVAENNTVQLWNLTRNEEEKTQSAVKTALSFFVPCATSFAFGRTVRGDDPYE